MKQEIPPAAIAGAIAVFVILVLILGYKFIMGGQNTGAAEAAYKQSQATKPYTPPPPTTGGPESHGGGGGQGSPGHMGSPNH